MQHYNDILNQSPLSIFSQLYRGRNEQLMIPRPVGESNLIPYFRMLTSMLDIYEARDDTDENRMVDMRPVLDALVDDTCKMVSLNTQEA